MTLDDLHALAKFKGAELPEAQQMNGVTLLKLAARSGVSNVRLSEQQVADVINHIVMADTKLASATGMVGVLQHRLHEALEEAGASR